MNYPGLGQSQPGLSASSLAPLEKAEACCGNQEESGCRQNPYWRSSALVL